MAPPSIDIISSLLSLYVQFERGAISDVGKYFPVLGDRAILSRSYASQLPHSGRPGGVLDLSHFIKRHYIKTVTLKHRKEEQPVHQYLHLGNALDYEEAIKGPKDADSEGPYIRQNHIQKRRNQSSLGLGHYETLQFWREEIVFSLG